jgi:hypothetical protein
VEALLSVLWKIMLALVCMERKPLREKATTGQRWMLLLDQGLSGSPGARYPLWSLSMQMSWCFLR